MLAWQSSAWEFGRGHGALFEYGSKLAHTCGTPNTLYRSCGIDDLTVPEEVRGKGCHLARRDIAAGELITTTYLGPQHTRQSALARQHLLRQSFGFVCECDHCRSGVDRYRGLPCPVCCPDVRDSIGVIDGKVATGQVAPKGVLWYDLDKVAAGDATPWQCDACGAQLPDDDQLLFGPLADHMRGECDNVEIKMFKLIQAWDASLAAQPIKKTHITDTTDKWASVARTVGPAHWATYRMYGLLAELHAGELSKYSLLGGALGQWMVQTKGLVEVVRPLGWLLGELTDDMDKMWGWMSRTTTPEEAADGMSRQFVRVANHILDAAEANLLPASSASSGSGSGSKSSSSNSNNRINGRSSSPEAVLEVQHQLAQLAGVLLRRIGPALDATRGWYLPHGLLNDWDVLSKRCERVLALPVVTLEEATRQQGRGTTSTRSGAPDDATLLTLMMEQVGLAAQPAATPGAPGAAAGTAGGTAIRAAGRTARVDGGVEGRAAGVTAGAAGRAGKPGKAQGQGLSEWLPAASTMTQQGGKKGGSAKGGRQGKRAKK